MTAKSLLLILAIFTFSCASHEGRFRPVTEKLSDTATAVVLRTVAFGGDPHMDSAGVALQTVHATIARRGVALALAAGATEFFVLGDVLEDGHFSEADSALAVFAPYHPHNPDARLRGICGNHDDDDWALFAIGKQWFPFQRAFETDLSQCYDDPQARVRWIAWYSGWNASDDLPAFVWLERMLATVPSGWMTVVLQHYPAYSQILRGGAQPSQAARFVPLMEEYGVAMVLAAHCHGGPEVYRATVGRPFWVVSGGLGMEESIANPDFTYSFWETHESQITHHVGIIDVSNAGMSVRFLSIDDGTQSSGEPLYEFFVSRSG